VEEIFSICTRVDLGQDVLPFSHAPRDQANAVVRELNEDGFRVVAVAHKTVPLSKDLYTVADEHALVLSGFIGFLDPPKATAREAIAALHEHGVAVVVLTGDNDVVTRRVVRRTLLDRALARGWTDFASALRTHGARTAPDVTATS
jgi:Mg2+-importing ATPase